MARLLLAATCLLTAITATTISPNVTAACADITAASINTDSLPLALADPDYIDAKTHYWSAANGDLSPACVTYPSSAEQVSQVVTILNRYADVQFAVKSGGHNPNVGWSSVDGGVLISMKNLSSTVYNAGEQTAEIGPGARWASVLSALEPYNVAVVSGRLGDVGVAGLSLGGGLSFLSGQYGLVCDNVVNFEVVQADGSIVNVNATNNPDQFFALKGGGNQFGIVTTFTMKTHPIGDSGMVWGGIRSYSGLYAQELINATQALTANYDPKSAVIVTAEIVIDGLLDLFVVFMFYDAATPPPGVFDAFNAVPHITDGTKTRTYADLLISDDTTNLYGLRYLIRATTLPNLPAPMGQTLLYDHYKTWKSYVIANNILHPGFIFSMAFQPMPSMIAAHGTAAGGNALGMDERNGDYMWMEYDVSWLTPIGDEDAHAIAMNITSTAKEQVKANYGGKGLRNTNAKEGAAVVGEGDGKGGENLVFLNDAMFDQLPLQSYGGDNYEVLKSTQGKYDPEGLWATRQGGFKFI